MAHEPPPAPGEDFLFFWLVWWAVAVQDFLAGFTQNSNRVAILILPTTFALAILRSPLTTA